MELDNLDTPVEPKQEAPKERDFVAEATSMGWNPDYDGDNKVDAKEFVLRKPLFDEQKKLKRKVRDLENAIRAQTQMQEALVHQEREKLLTQYKAEKKEALETGDADRVIALEDEMDKLKRTPVRAPNQPPPEFTEWVDQNDWYSEDAKLRRYADALGIELYNQNPGRPLRDIYAEVTRDVKETFAAKFKNPLREKPSPVDSGSRAPTKTVEVEPEIPQEYKQVFHTLWRAGAWGSLSKKDAAKKYAADLANAGAAEA